MSLNWYALQLPPIPGTDLLQIQHPRGNLEMNNEQQFEMRLKLLFIRLRFRQ
jgi:hypothetical protein